MKVLVYQMGKVASASIHRSLLAHGGVDVEHVHEVDPSYVMNMRGVRSGSQEWTRLARLRALMRSNEPLRVITLVREPIARNASLLWENYGAEITAHPELERSFWDALPHDEVLTWFDREFKQALGFDVYAYDFDRQFGWSTYWSDAHEILVIKCEADDVVKQTAISVFLELPTLVLHGHNVNNSPEYAEFKDRFKVPRAYVDMMATAKYTRHFYSAGEIDVMREKWTER